MSKTKETNEVQTAEPAFPKELWDRATSGDQEALDEIMPIIRDNPNWAAILIDSTETRLISMTAGDDLLTREALAKLVTDLRANLSEHDPSAIERLLIDRIIACWLHLHQAEVLFGRPKEVTNFQARYLENRLNGAHRRYLGAIKSLATVRKLLAPTKRSGSSRMSSADGKVTRDQASSNRITELLSGVN